MDTNESTDLNDLNDINDIKNVNDTQDIDDINDIIDTNVFVYDKYNGLRRQRGQRDSECFRDHMSHLEG